MKVLIALSGGVDSSMSAKILLDAGFSVIGCYMMLHDKPNYHERNIANVQKVGDFLGIKTQILNLKEQFKHDVYNLFVSSYAKGITPNPCAHCNRLIKFGALWEFAKKNGCQKIATGHYARIENGLLKVAVDKSKDQSYFLSNIEPAVLSHIIFPLGDKLKKDIKANAAKFPQIAELATQKESSEICFVENSYTEILARHFNTQMRGVVRDSAGRAIGEHDGYMNYTIGKRKGFRVHGAHEPHFVTAINPENNEISVGLKKELEKTSFETLNFNNFTNETNFKCFVKIRYKSEPVPCVVRQNGRGGVFVELLRPASAIASGQLACFYDEQARVLASGFIA